MGMEHRASSWIVSTLSLAACLAGGLVSEATAQDTCGGGLDFVSEWDGYFGQYADIWAEGDIAYIGTFGDNLVQFIDISDPANPVRIHEWSVQAPNNFGSAQDVKVHGGLLFIGMESNGFDGAEIVDVRDPFNPVHLTWIDLPTFSSVHNLFYDSGYLYMVDSGSPRVVVVDLTTYDPDDPPDKITESLWLLNGVGSSFVHDITVANGRMYACGWNSGLYVYDVTNIANEPPVFLGAGPNSPATHAVWPSADGRWAVVGEERSEGPLRLYEIIPNGAALDIVLRDTVTIFSAFSIHNPIVVGTRVYAAWYTAGLRIYDIDEQNAKLVEVEVFDTWLGGANGGFGNWGVFPLLGTDRILASDVANGLFVLNAGGGGCDDGVFCNGVETCDGGGCVAGVDPCPGQFCSEADERCVECFGDGDCDNGTFCDGPETCSVDGVCLSGVPPCFVAALCVEEQGRCVECLDDAGCDDSSLCTEDSCISGDCVNSPILYGDGNLDGTVDLGDILCVLDGFAGDFERCTFVSLDIADCAPDDEINLSDILAVLDAFAGVATCCNGS